MKWNLSFENRGIFGKRKSPNVSSGEQIVVESICAHGANEDQDKNVSHAGASLKDASLYYNIMEEKEMQGGG